MATHSSVLAWRIPGTGEPSGLPSLGSHIAPADKSSPPLFHTQMVTRAWLKQSFLKQQTAQRVSGSSLFLPPDS